MAPWLRCRGVLMGSLFENRCTLFVVSSTLAQLTSLVDRETGPGRLRVVDAGRDWWSLARYIFGVDLIVQCIVCITTLLQLFESTDTLYIYCHFNIEMSISCTYGSSIESDVEGNHATTDMTSMLRGPAKHSPPPSVSSSSSSLLSAHLHLHLHLI
ncbi:hypothetical protein BJX70DRAFT_54638 [Aspergillus crustosus]